jgi:hypothetical protein
MELIVFVISWAAPEITPAAITMIHGFPTLAELSLTPCLAVIKKVMVTSIRIVYMNSDLVRPIRGHVHIVYMNSDLVRPRPIRGHVHLA